MEAGYILSPIVTEFFLRGKRFNFLLLLMSQSYFKVPKTIRLKATHYFIMKISIKREHHHHESLPRREQGPNLCRT